MYDIPAIIFAGGKSSRMGKDKALLPFKNQKTLSQYQYHRLRELFSDVYLSTKENKFNFSCEVIKDIHPEYSPLVGLISCFDLLGDQTLFILSVDAPLVDKHIIQTLYEASQKDENKDKDAIIAQSPNGLQPLCGFYRRSILPLAKKSLLKNNHKLTAIIQQANTYIVSFKEEKAFTNLNTIEQYNTLLFT